MHQPGRSYALGHPNEATHPDSIRAALAEFFSTFIFVFAGEGSLLAISMHVFSYLRVLFMYIF